MSSKDLFQIAVFFCSTQDLWLVTILNNARMLGFSYPKNVLKWHHVFLFNFPKSDHAPFLYHHVLFDELTIQIFSPSLLIQNTCLTVMEYVLLLLILSNNRNCLYYQGEVSEIYSYVWAKNLLSEMWFVNIFTPSVSVFSFSLWYLLSNQS